MQFYLSLVFRYNLWYFLFLLKMGLRRLVLKSWSNCQSCYLFSKCSLFLILYQRGFNAHYKMESSVNQVTRFMSASSVNCRWKPLRFSPVCVQEPLKVLQADEANILFFLPNFSFVYFWADTYTSVNLRHVGNSNYIKGTLALLVPHRTPYLLF